MLYIYICYIYTCFCCICGCFSKWGFPNGYSAGTFAAVAPWFGLPLLGYGLGAQFELVRYTKDGATVVGPGSWCCSSGDGG